MYIKLNNGVIEKYPYSIGELRKDNPNTSFPKNPSLELLAEWSVFPVQSVEPPSIDHTKNCFEDTPLNNNGSWIQAWTVVDASEEEIQSRTKDQSNSVRNKRDRLLLDTDWVVIKNLEIGQNVPPEWTDYRQSLRDITVQDGFPWNVTWPVKP